MSKESSWVEEINKKYDDKFIDIVPSDIHFSDYRPSVNSIHIRASNKKHYIVWVDLLHKAEHAIDLPKIGDNVELSTGSICGFNQFGRDIIRENEIWDIIGEPEDKGTDTEYPKIKVELVDCRIDTDNEYNSSYKSFKYLFLYKIVDERLGELKGSYVVSSKNGFDKDFEKKFNHEKYNGLSYYEVKKGI